jgi:hypothetical protein
MRGHSSEPRKVKTPEWPDRIGRVWGRGVGKKGRKGDGSVVVREDRRAELIVAAAATI